MNKKQFNEDTINKYAEDVLRIIDASEAPIDFQEKLRTNLRNEMTRTVINVLLDLLNKEDKEEAIKILEKKGNLSELVEFAQKKIPDCDCNEFAIKALSLFKLNFLKKCISGLEKMEELAS